MKTQTCMIPNSVSDSDPRNYLNLAVEKSVRAKLAFYQESSQTVVEVASLLAQRFKAGNKLLLAGNGGSAADAQHMAAELVGRMLMERKKPLPAIALTTDTSNLTAIANDYTYDDIFDFQLRALGRPGDVFWAISTSGNSKNILKAVESARSLGLTVVSLTGGSGGTLKGLSDWNFNVALGEHASMVQETHLTILHNVVDLMDRFFLDSNWVTPKKGV